MNVQELLAEVATAPVVKRAVTNHSTLNEAYDYGSAFSRGMRIDLNGLTILLISGQPALTTKDELYMSATSGRNFGVRTTTLQSCCSLKGRPGTISSAPPATSAT